jgi:ribonuclease HI
MQEQQNVVMYPAQLASVIFRRWIDASDDAARVEIRWILGHKGFASNERADSVAKAAINDAARGQPEII